METAPAPRLFGSDAFAPSNSVPSIHYRPNQAIRVEDFGTANSVPSNGAYGGDRIATRPMRAESNAGRSGNANATKSNASASILNPSAGSCQASR